MFIQGEENRIVLDNSFTRSLSNLKFCLCLVPIRLFISWYLSSTHWSQISGLWPCFRMRASINMVIVANKHNKIFWNNNFIKYYFPVNVNKYEIKKVLSLCIIENFLAYIQLGIIDLQSNDILKSKEGKFTDFCFSNISPKKNILL